MNFRIWKPIVFIGLLGACSESAEPPREPEPARETGYLRCQAAAPGCAGAESVGCVDQGGRSTCVEAPAACAAFDCACASSLCGEAACTDLPGEAIACAVAGPPATCQGASVIRPEGTYCVVPDGDQYPCPADAPARTSQRGTAICRAESVPAPEAEAADAIAVAGLQTGLILAASNVTRLDLPEAAGKSPGVATGSLVTVTAEITYYGGAPFTPDGAPVSCGVSFDHLDQRIENGAIVIRAWDRVTCGSAYGQLITTETHPIDLVAPAPGLYLVLPGFGSQGNAEGFGGQYLVVDQIGACGVPPPIESCFSGFLFADCGGDLPPAIWCPEDGGSCLWFTGGCPAAEYTEAIDCSNTEFCPTPHLNWGPEPWDRERAMVVEVAIDAAVMAPSEVAVTCTCDAPPCINSRATLCNPDEVMKPRYRSGDWWNDAEARNGLFVFTIVPLDADNTSSIGSIFLLAEVDLAAAGGPRARACLVESSDGGAANTPVCAASGRLVLDRAVANATDAAAAHGTAVLEFETAPIQSGPLRIDLAF